MLTEDCHSNEYLKANGVDVVDTDLGKKILAAVKANKPDFQALPDINIPASEDNLIEKYKQVATGIGTNLCEINNLLEIKTILVGSFDRSLRWLTTVSDFNDMAGMVESEVDQHSLEDVEVAIIEASFGVAENSALWVSEESPP